MPSWQPGAVPVWAVGLACTIGALASGLGALPFCVWRTWRTFDGPGGRRWAGLANGIATMVRVETLEVPLVMMPTCLPSCSTG